MWRQILFAAETMFVALCIHAYLLFEALLRPTLEFEPVIVKEIVTIYLMCQAALVFAYIDDSWTQEREDRGQETLDDLDEDDDEQSPAPAREKEVGDE